MEQLKTEKAVKGYDDNNTIEKSTQYIVIRLGKEQYGIDIGYIDNIVRMQNITRIPKMPVYLKGVINLRGEVIPVMSLRLKMNLPEDEIVRATRIIILKLEEQGTVGIIVDEVREVVSLGTSQIEKNVYDSNEEGMNFISGVGHHNGELISILDISTLKIEEPE